MTNLLSLRRITAIHLILLGVLWFAPQLDAHDFNYGVIKTELSAEGNVIKLETDLSQQINSKPGEALEKEVTTYFAEHFRIQQDGKPCAFKFIQFENPAEYQWLIDSEYTCNSPITSPRDVTIESEIFTDLYEILDHFVTFSIGEKQWDLVFTSDHQKYPENVKATYAGGPVQSLPVVAGQFIWSGMMHIWTGYDHILFLLSVILLMRSWKKTLLLVTAFTIAHSITLILAGLGIVTLSPRIVEPVIALSIAYMAVRNILALQKNKGQENISERWMTTFGFGLIHGLGFAGALMEADIPQKYFVPSLIIFNVGIEIGQLIILAIAVPLLLQIDRVRHQKKILIALSGIITALALFWFFERILG